MKVNSKHDHFMSVTAYEVFIVINGYKHSTIP